MERIRIPRPYPVSAVAYTDSLLVPYACFRDYGVTTHQLRSGGAPAVVRGVHAHPSAMVAHMAPEWADDDWRTVAQKVRALAMLVPGAVAAGPTAAKLWGIPLPWEYDLESLHMTIPADRHRTRIPDVTVHRSQRYANRTCYGLPVNRVLYTLTELAPLLGKKALVQAIDSVAGHWRGAALSSVGEITEQLAALKRYPGRRRILSAAALARDFTRSPKETDWRLRIVEAGMPEPVPNWIIETGPDSYRELDLAFVDYKVAGSYQGYADHLRLDEQVAHDGTRSVDVQLAGWLEVPITRVLPPGEYLRQLREALISRGWRP